ncbi:hypothetical protein, conserved [Plasmodium ovale wallikeri]|uniref:PDZ domain-containing protein n=2 Tax=Plasmodium ovale TaxID=36330 RepID=A0A1A8YSM0_PLAOA|nr:hypothetical protein, conserved [Plasmodium ovale wallikeri]SBT35060.1 hypothetical protein, conserved [Plasmodium ovale wallikeri]SBT76890.1 conserved Plasmodium protein, unknown function [Plasmodium ovale]
MSKLLALLCTFYLFFDLCKSVKVQQFSKKNILLGYKNKGRPFNERATFLCKSFPIEKDVKRDWFKLFYRNKKEKDIFESGYLYPFDHLEKKKKKFPPDPYVPTDEEKEENSFDVFDDKQSENDLLSYDDDGDAKKHFGKTTFNMPNGLPNRGEDADQVNGEVGTVEDELDKVGTASPDHVYDSAIKDETQGENQFRNDIYWDDTNLQNSAEKESVREIINITVHASGANKIESEMVKDKLYYLFHSSMDRTFIKFFELHIESHLDQEGKQIFVSCNFKNKNFKTAIASLSNLIDFSNTLKKFLNDKMEELMKGEENEDTKYLNKILRKEFEIHRKEKNITTLSKNNLQKSVESSLKLIEKCTQKLYSQNYEITLYDLKLAYNMLPCKYYGYFLSHVCSNISMLCYYTNDLQGTFNFALKSIKYEPQCSVAWKCLGDAYRSFRKFWQAKNFYDIAIYLGYKDDKGENFEEITHELNNLTQSALKNVNLLKENMNNSLQVIIKKNIGIVLNKNPDSIGGCYVSYIIEGSKASKQNFHHGDQIVALNNIVTYGKPIDYCLKAFQKNDGSYDIIFFKGNIIELYGLEAYKYLTENNLFYTLFENEKISSFKRNENILFDMKGFGTFSEYGMSKRGL